MVEEFRKLYEAVKSWNWSVIDKFMKNARNINASLVSTGPQAGYTALHFASMEKTISHVEILIKDYRANVNSVGEDGAQPIHLALLFKNIPLVKILLESGADVDAEVSKKLCEKYTKDIKWSDNFGGTMTLLTFAVINNNGTLVKILINHKANIGIKDTTNKTLLMYALENDDLFSVLQLTQCMKNNPDLINARDNNGFHTIHYLLPKKKFGDFRYDLKVTIWSVTSQLINALIDAGVDINVIIDDDPDTLLLNISAYRCCWNVLQKLLYIKVPFGTQSRPLFYATLPVVPEKYMRMHNDFGVDFVRKTLMEQMLELKDDCIKLILEDLKFRREFEIFVPEEEKNLMDQLVATDIKLKKIVSDYQSYFIDGILKNETMQCGDRFITFYEIVEKVFDDKLLKLLVKDDYFLEAYTKFYANSSITDHAMYQLFNVMDVKIKVACQRRKLMRKIEEISRLLESLPLPYEVILDIIDYVDNESLKMLIDAFYQDSHIAK